MPARLLLLAAPLAGGRRGAPQRTPEWAAGRTPGKSPIAVPPEAVRSAENAEACGTLRVIMANIPGGDEEHDTIDILRITY